MTAAVLDIELWRGDNDPAIVWELVDEGGQPFLEPGSAFVLVVEWRGGTLRKETTAADGFVYDATNGRATWTPSFAESRMVPKGNLSEYRLQRRTGDHRRTFAVGRLIGRGDALT